MASPKRVLSPESRANQTKYAAWYRKKHKEQVAATNRRYNVKRLYGITEDDVIEMLAAQGGLCAICLNPLTYPHPFTNIDHCHKTGRVRGILCGDCNSGLGRFKDNTANLIRAWRYLRRG